MTDETVECFNCGRANPAWAQVCRSCGVPLRTSAHETPLGRVPTDQRSLVSIAAAVGTIFAAVLVGLLISSMNPVEPTVGLTSASPTPSASSTPRATPTPEPAATDTPVPSTEPTPVPLPGTLAFGSGFNGAELSGGTDTFAPGSLFAHQVTMPTPFSTNVISEGVVRIADDGTETPIVDPAGNTLGVDPNATQANFGPIGTDDLRNALGGPGTFRMEVYLGEQKVAEATFKLTEG